jgi:hypothetical protein
MNLWLGKWVTRRLGTGKLQLSPRPNENYPNRLYPQKHVGKSIKLQLCRIDYLGAYAVRFPFAKALRFAIGAMIIPWSVIDVSPSIAMTPDELARKLIASSWPAAAAAKAASVQAVIQTQAELSNPELANERLQKLKSLGKFPVATKLMLSHPELAGLIMHADDPMRVAEILSSVADRPEVINTIMTFAGDSEQVIFAIDRHRKALLALTRSGAAIQEIPVGLFLNTSESDVAYRQFIEDVLLWTVGSQERRLAVVGSLNRCSDKVRQMFATAPLQTQEAAKEWMAYCNTHPDHVEWMCSAYFEIDQLIRFFLIPRSREMAERVGIRAAVLLLASDLRPQLIAQLPHVLVYCDEEMIVAIPKLRDKLGIVELLARRSLSPATMKAALLEALQNPERLSKWISMTDQAIAREVGTSDIGLVKHVPFVEVAVKLVDGQELTILDGVMIAADTASLVFPLVKGVSGLRSAGAVLKADVKEIAKAYGDDIVQKALKMDVKELQQKLPDVYEAAAKKAMTTRLKEGGFDVTGLTRLAFQQVGKRSSSFKKFTGLDSKVFMRSDRVVVIYPHQTFVGRVLAEVIVSQSAELALNQSSEGIVQAKKKIDHATQQLNAIWVACNEPGGFGELFGKATSGN